MRIVIPRSEGTGEKKLEYFGCFSDNHFSRAGCGKAVKNSRQVKPEGKTRDTRL